MNQELEIDRKLLDRIISNFDFNGRDKNLNMMDVINRVYDATYMFFKLSYHEEKNLREKYERKVIEKNTIIEELQEKLKAVGEDGSEKDSDSASEGTEPDLFREGSNVDQGNT